MIKLVKMECPGCGGVLKKKGLKTYKCNYCNAQYVLDVDIILPVPDKNVNKKDNIKDNVKVNKKVNKEVNKNTKGPKAVEQNTSAYLGAIICVIVVVLIAGLLISNSRDRRSTQTQQSTKQEVVAVADKGVKSPYMKEFVSLVFDKEPEQVTTEEYNEITYFVMHDNRYVVDYKRNDGELKTVTITKDLSINYDDFKCFPEIKVLKWEAYKEENSALQYLPKLEELTCTTSPYIILNYLPNPEILRKFSSRYYEDGAGVGEIERFENLTDLSLYIIISSISDVGAPDLSGVAKLSKLENFYLDNDEYQTVSFLSDMQSLKSINLHCDALKDLNFIKKLEGLESLTLVDCDILSVENLKYTPNLKVLRLEDCYKIDSLEPVVDLVQLEELMLSNHYGQIVPDSFKSLDKVTRLTMAGFNDVSFLSDFPNLTFLQLYGCNYTNFDKVACMTNLQELKLGGGTSLASVSALLGLTKLEKVDFEGVTTGADSEKLFLIPNLKELNVNDTEFAIDLNVIEKNESLEILYMENAKWKAYNTTNGAVKYKYDDWQSLPMGECIDFLENFPNLRILSIQGNKVENVEFTLGLTKLESLDITNNYISNLQTLNELPNLSEVFCGENPLDTEINLDDRITVYSDTKATERWPFVHYNW